VSSIIVRDFRAWALTALVCAAALSAGCSSAGSAPAPRPSAAPTASSAVPSASPTPLTAPAPATLFFQPLPGTGIDWPQGPPGRGSVDFVSLFQPNAPWTRALARTKVFGLYVAWVATVSDQELQQVISFLNARGIGIELEAAALQATATCGSGVEGYVGGGTTVHDFTLRYLQRLKALNAQVVYIKVDEPFFFGSVTNDPRSCHFQVADVASQIGQYVQVVHTVYPNAAVGDVEPIIAASYSPDVVTAIGQWHDAFRLATGADFPFFFADLDYADPAWPTLAKALENQTRQRGMKFGIIYIGDDNDPSDSEWSGKVVARFQQYQGPAGGHPDYVLFQSWEPHPVYTLPETDPTTFTGAIDAYINQGL